jgi:photosystem II stability/assembly factor-like uncharacterized protein
VRVNCCWNARHADQFDGAFVADAVAVGISSAVGRGGRDQTVTGADAWNRQLRAVSADLTNPNDTKIAPELVIWAAGSNGVVLRSPDDGKSWKLLRVEGGEKPDFRGLASFGDRIAYLMSVGENGLSRICKTADAGQSWRLQYSDKRLEVVDCKEIVTFFPFEKIGERLQAEEKKAVNLNGLGEREDSKALSATFTCCDSIDCLSYQ